MDRFPNGYVIDATYRVESVISDTDRAQVYVVTHLRFPEAPLVLKVAAHARTEDFDRDTNALSILTSQNIARVCDRGKLSDGRLYRVAARLEGPTLREALLSHNEPGGRPFPEARAMELLVSLAAVVHEAHSNNLAGPIDLSVNNLMFANGRGGRLCLMRALVVAEDNPVAGVPAALVQQNPLDKNTIRQGGKPSIHQENQHALTDLRVALELGRDSGLGMTAKWTPPALGTVEEIRAAMSRTPKSSEPGTQIDQWRIVQQIAETLYATVYEVIGNAGQLSILKVAGPRCDHEEFVRSSRLLAQITSPHVVRILDAGSHEGAPYVVMERLHVSLATLVKHEQPMPFTEALEIVDDMIDGAEEVARKGGGPTDFSLEHAYQATSETARVAITHASAPQRVFRLYGSPTEREAADVWSAVVALYELITQRLPFPTSKHSLAKAWMGVPVPMGSRRRDVPPALSLLVTRVLGNDVRLSTRELRAELRRLRATPLPNRVPIPTAPPPSSSSSPSSSAPSTGTSPGMGAAVVPSPPFPLAPPSDPDVGGINVDDYRRSVEPPPVIELGQRVSLPPTHKEGAGGAGAKPPAGAAAAAATPDWRIELSSSRCPFSPIICAAITANGRQVVAVGREAVARYSAQQWTIDPARDLETTHGSVRSLVPMAPALGRGGAGSDLDGSWLALTTRGRVLRLGKAGGFTPWGPVLDRFCFNAAIAEADGSFVLVGGSNDKRRGVIAKMVGESLTIIASDLHCRPLLAVAKLSDDSLIACGESGHVVRIRNGAIIAATRPCEVDLLTAMTLRDLPSADAQVLIAGAGAWAFRLEIDPLKTHVEAVDTLSSLTCMSIDDKGTAWIGTNKGRILRRRDHHWRRMNRTFTGDPAVLAIYASPTRLRAILADGHLVRGVPL